MVLVNRMSMRDAIARILRRLSACPKRGLTLSGGLQRVRPLFGQAVSGSSTTIAQTSRHNRRAQNTRRRLLVENVEERRLMAIDLQLLNTSDGVAIYGATTGDWSGTTVSKTGDINGDGYDDLLIGAVYADNGSKSDAGASYLLFGGPALPATLDLANIGVAGVKILGAETDDASGAWITAADLNADGFDDLVIGSPTADGLGNGRSNSGETQVIYGSASLPSVIDLSLPGSAGLTVFGAEPNDESGSTIAGLGDVNGDGYDDFIIGASSADGINNSKLESGESYLIYGGATLPTTIDLATLQASQGVVLLGVDVGDGSGVSVSGAGDINADGYNDLLIGAVKADGLGNTAQTDDTGEAYLIYGGPALPSTISLGNIAALGVTIYGAVPNTLTGIGLSGAGDVNGDGYDDFLVGTYLSDGPANNTFAVGAANLIFGGPALSNTINLATLGSGGMIFYGEEYYDLAGWSVSSAGDLNDDGLDDLLIGATYARAPGDALYTYAGKSYVIYGSTSLSGSMNLASLGTSGFPIFGADPGDISGWSVSGVGDVNGDGFADSLIGAPNADAANNLKSDAGESYLLYGGRQASSVTHSGTAIAETIVGTSGADNINGARGNDTLISAGGADVLFGGEGNDLFALSDLNFARLTGGNGSDTLRLDGSGMTLDLNSIKNNRLRGIEQIDITGSGNNTLTLSQLELLNLSDESNTLLVRRDAGDIVDYGVGWITGGLETIGSVVYQVYTQGAATLKLQLSNQAPTAIMLSNVTSSIAENTPTVVRIKIADLTVIDDGIGSNTYSIVGPDAAYFEIDSGVLYLKAATVLDYETKSTYTIILQVDDTTVGSTPDVTATYVLNVTDVNEPVVLTVTNSLATGFVGSALTNSGTWFDPEGGSVTLAASVGTVTMNVDGTWSWTYTPNGPIVSQIVTISANDNLSASTVTFEIRANVQIAVVGRRTFYNSSSWDNNGEILSASDSAAIATDKQALLPNQKATIANYTSYVNGITGIAVDISGLSSLQVQPSLSTLSSFFSFKLGRTNTTSTWAAAPAPTTLSVLYGIGTGSSDRVLLGWANGVIRNTWLEVSVLANATTGLPAQDRFYFGNAIGDTGDSTANTNVNATDVARIQSNFTNFLNPATIANLYDINRDKRVNATDVAIVQSNFTNFLTVLPLIKPA